VDQPQKLTCIECGAPSERCFLCTAKQFVKEYVKSGVSKIQAVLAEKALEQLLEWHQKKNAKQDDKK